MKQSRGQVRWWSMGGLVWLSCAFLALAMAACTTVGRRGMAPADESRLIRDAITTWLRSEDRAGDYGIGMAQWFLTELGTQGIHRAEHDIWYTETRRWHYSRHPDPVHKEYGGRRDDVVLVRHGMIYEPHFATWVFHLAPTTNGNLVVREHYVNRTYFPWKVQMEIRRDYGPRDE